MALQNKICVGCNKQFEGRPNAKACSSKCRKRFFRARQAIAQEVEKLAQLRDEIKQDIHGSLALPALAPAEAEETVSDYEPDDDLNSQPELLDSLDSSEAVIAPAGLDESQVSAPPAEEPIFSQDRKSTRLKSSHSSISYA